MIFIHHKMLQIRRRQDPALTARRAVDATGVRYLVPPGLVEDSCSRRIRLVGESHERVNV